MNGQESGTIIFKTLHMYQIQPHLWQNIQKQINDPT